MGRGAWAEEIATALALHKALQRFAMTIFIALDGNP